MTKSESAKIIYVMKSYYPGFFQKLSAKDIENMADAWQYALDDVSYSDVSAGLKVFVRRDTKGFPPSPGQVIDCITKVQEPQDLTATEAWTLVVRAMSNSAYHAEEEFAQLPEVVQRAVGSARNLKELALMDTDTVQSVEKSHFIRTYNTCIQDQRELAKLPADMRQLAEIVNMKLPEPSVEKAIPELPFQYDPAEVPEEIMDRFGYLMDEEYYN